MTSTSSLSDEQRVGQEFCTFLTNSCSPFHVVEDLVSRCKTKGFKQISEKEEWNLKQNGLYYLTRNQSAFIAVAVGGKYKPGNGFTIMAGHSDQPVLKLKPVSKISSNGFLQLAVECYGGGLWHTWFDRDLSVAGRVLVAKDKALHSMLVKIKRPILRIPSLAIHMNRSVNDSGFLFNLQQHLSPILATSTIIEKEQKKNEKCVCEKDQKEDKEKKEEKKDDKEKAEDEHHSALMECIAKELSVKPEDIKAVELMLYDTQPAQLGGLTSEFVYGRGLDNLCSTFTITKAFLQSVEMKDSLANDDRIRVMAIFDHEECGSQSTHGASSDMMKQILARLVGNEKLYDVAIAKSFLISSDTAHAVHPNYSDKHDERHKPHMQKGLVVKTNSNQRYATTPMTAYPLFAIAKKHNIPLQKFSMRNDMPCGTTIGPILSALTSIRTVDVGIPQHSMHSIRESCHVSDVESTIRLLAHFYDEFPALDETIHVDT
eukprot:TRINITY_DN372_c0_g1_i1.p1 TRINITY_DN372_c0_g1~~TRINITY_DN372_c0_g1_i1.p1  ORF type:complete len:506 (-),score=108.54 TRINITY_DN372_c0_g1_i1:351-1811(-)